MPEGKMPFIDFRSDTITWPTAKMRQAMANADVGDDVYEEDPTVIRLEKLSAGRMGKEAGLFVPSGTMGNLVSVLTHCGRGDEVILGDISHTFVYEAGGISALGGVFPHTLPNQPDGKLKLEDIRSAIRPDNVHFPKTRLVILENTHNRCGGAVLDEDYTRQVADIAHQAGFPLHLDGARIFNASVVLGRPVRELTAKFDSVMVCLSKGLGAPVGSLLVGSKEFIEEGRLVRKMLGGGMRQAGVLAAAGLVALEESPKRLHLDHENAKFLARSLAEIPGIKIDPEKVVTNILFFDVSATGLMAPEISRQLAGQGILANAFNPKLLRMVTHCDVDRQGCARALNVLRSIMDGAPMTYFV